MNNTTGSNSAAANSIIGPSADRIDLYQTLYNQAAPPNQPISRQEAAALSYPTDQLTLPVMRALLDWQARIQPKLAEIPDLLAADPKKAVKYAQELGLTPADLGPPPPAQ